MSPAKWIAALVLGSLPLAVLADPLAIFLTTSAELTTFDSSFYEFAGGLEPGAPVTVEFNVEHNLEYATVSSGTLTTPPQSSYYNWDVTVGSAHLGIPSPSGSVGPFPNQLQLRDNVRNAAGDLVDVFDMTLGALPSVNETYTMTAHLEFAPDTFGDLDAWSILALENARLLGGSIDLHRRSERYDATFIYSNLHAEVNGFDARFTGPGAEVPPVPEPGQPALLLAGLAAAAVLRRVPHRAWNRSF